MMVQFDASSFGYIQFSKRIIPLSKRPLLFGRFTSMELLSISL